MSVSIYHGIDSSQPMPFAVMDFLHHIVFVLVRAAISVFFLLFIFRFL